MTYQDKARIRGVSRQIYAPPTHYDWYCQEDSHHIGIWNGHSDTLPISCTSDIYTVYLVGGSFWKQDIVVDAMAMDRAQRVILALAYIPTKA